MDLITEGVSAAVGGALGRGTAFPLDSLKTKIAAGAGKSAMEILRQEGLLALYRGCHFAVVEASWTKAATFFIYAWLKKIHNQVVGGDPNVFSGIALGYLADLACVPSSAPLEIMVSNLQAGTTKNLQNLNVTFFLTAIRNAFRASLFLSLKPAMEMAFFDLLKKRYIRLKKSAITPLVAFFLGAIARCLSTFIVYPFLRVKILQQTIATDVKMSPVRFIAHLKDTEGMLALYRGLSMELARGVTQSSVMFMVMEQVKETIVRVLSGTE
eukprot:GEMP01037983.1.p1 GENE.GEMP01037983.1~~GEMP01037983.1.p1  ORF type:complete len:269 (+),score=42.08 GEMP01037983.1:89-895(+)